MRRASWQHERANKLHVKVDVEKIGTYFADREKDYESTTESECTQVAFGATNYKPLDSNNGKHNRCRVYRHNGTLWLHDNTMFLFPDKSEVAGKERSNRTTAIVHTFGPKRDAGEFVVRLERHRGLFCHSHSAKGVAESRKRSWSTTK